MQLSTGKRPAGGSGASSSGGESSTLYPTGDRSATVKRSIFILHQIPDPLPPALGSTEILQKSVINSYSATVKRSVFTLNQFPGPIPSKIGEEDLPGGFIKEAILSGRKNPTSDMVKGIVQVDDIKVLFNTWA